MIKDKKANIPVTILVIGIFALCAFALFTFFLSDFKVSNSFVGVDLMKKINSNIDDYLFYKNQGISKEDRLSYFKNFKEGGVDYLFVEQNSKDGKLLFYVQYPVN